jgi:hypothetical protein
VVTGWHVRTANLPTKGVALHPPAARPKPGGD